MAVTGIGNTYNNGYENAYAVSVKKTAEKEKTQETGSAEKEIAPVRKQDSKEYLRGLQRQVSDVTLETGSALNMKRDNKMGTVTINPKLLERMQNDPEAEKKYTQLIKDIERAEQTATAYYNSMGGCVERSSHWYIDENGQYTHFAYTRRDDRRNKKLRKEARENAERLVEKNRERAIEKRKKLKEALDKRLEEKRVEAEEKEGQGDKPGELERFAAEIPESPEKGKEWAIRDEKAGNESTGSKKAASAYHAVQGVAKEGGQTGAAGASLDVSL